MVAHLTYTPMAQSSFTTNMYHLVFFGGDLITVLCLSVRIVKFGRGSKSYTYNVLPQAKWTETLENFKPTEARK